jgi:hypothetical protein
METEQDPCAECGRGTAAGTIGFSDRRVVEREDLSRGFLCGDCQAAIVAARRGEPLSDDEVRRRIDSGVAAMAWASGPGAQGQV